ncbi:MAG: 23S rRNA (guanosine(2251)-2'-O)-methyltransferase RlmB [Bacilli bacterium]|nr:23S rRNA (guanosine(2251)-2'-O)-methyltransferase RlmB [Bacilli bacterium]
MGNELFIIGRNPVREALISSKVTHVVLSDSFSDKSILELINLHSIPVKRVPTSYLDKNYDGVHQGIVAFIKPYEYIDLNEIIRRSKQVKVPIIIMLDGINDPHNLGAIIRSADVFNASGVIIGKHNQVPLNATVAKTSAGAINYVPVAVVNNLNQAIAKLKENGFWVVSTDGSANISYSEIKYDFPVCLVVGSEGNGVSKLVLKNSDYIVKIPQFGHVNSLNASVAAAIMLAEIRR